MKYIELLIGTAIGYVGGIVTKDIIVPNNQSQDEALQNQLDIANQQIDDLKKKEKELKEELSKRVVEIQSIRNKVRDKEDESDDKEDELDKLKLINKRILSENEEFKHKLDELELLYESKKQELEAINKHK